MFTDHLGNVRLSYKNTSTTGVALQIVEENNYYPFGLKHKGYNNTPIPGQRDHKYGFGGKEEQDELGLEWHDFHARNYDASLGRWMNLDPHSESYYDLSPYNYGFNNPISVTDPDGMDGVVTGSGTKDDPYIVSANYYYYDLSKEQLEGLNGAISQYNNGGEAFEIEGKNKSTQYVKFMLTAIKSSDEDSAIGSANGDYIDGNRFGNVVEASERSDGDDTEFGNGNNSKLNLLNGKINSYVSNNPSRNDKKTIADLIEATFVHEIGHNLGGNHGDIGSIMLNALADEISASSRSTSANSGLGVNNSTGVFRYRQLANVNAQGVQAIIGRVDEKRATYHSRYMTEKQNSRVTSGTAGKLSTISK